MKGKIFYTFLILVLPITLFLFTPVLQTAHGQLLEQSPLPESLKRPATLPVPEEFRGILSDWAYVEADRHFHQGEWEHIIPYLRLSLVVSPERTEAWSTGSWHLAFNMAEAAGTPAGRDELIQQGITFLEEALQKHPDVAHLYFDLGWTLFKRKEEYSRAAALFRQSLELEYDPRCVIWMAYAYRKMGDAAGEAQVWQNHLKLFPGDQKARDHYEEALKLESDRRQE